MSVEFRRKALDVVAFFFYAFRKKKRGTRRRRRRRKRAALEECGQRHSLPRVASAHRPALFFRVVARISRLLSATAYLDVFRFAAAYYRDTILSNFSTKPTLYTYLVIRRSWALRRIGIIICVSSVDVCTLGFSTAKNETVWLFCSRAR